MGADGVAKPSGGTLTAFEPPSGPGVRVDTFGYAGYRTSPRFDSLLAKLIVHSPTDGFADAVAKAHRALCEFRIAGVPTNIGFLQSLLQHPAFAGNRTLYAVHRRAHRRAGRRGQFRSSPALLRVRLHQWRRQTGVAQPGARQAGARIDTSDPLAVLHHGKGSAGDAPAAANAPAPAAPSAFDLDGPDGTVAIAAPMQGTIISIDVREGDAVSRRANSSSWKR